MDTQLRSTPYYGLDCVASAARANAPVWIEGMSITADGSIANILYACAWHVDTVAISVDVDTGIFFIESGNQELAQCVTSLNAKVMTIVAGGARSPSLAESVVSVTKEIRKIAERIWPKLDLQHGLIDLRSTLLADAVKAISSLASYPIDAPLHASAKSKGISALAGLHTLAGLFSNSLRHVRAPVVCKPVPFWALNAEVCGKGHKSSSKLFAASRTSDVHMSQSPQSGNAMLEWDSEILGRALEGFPLPNAYVNRFDVAFEDAVTEVWSAVSFNTLLLLHWLAVCCPVSLLRLATSPTGVHTTFAVVRKPFPPSAANTPLMRHWDANALRLHHEYKSIDGSTCRWFHGTSSENVYSTIAGGLRSMSGTRFERNGSMFGDGIYLVNDVSVARSFAKRTGVVVAAHGLDFEWNSNLSEGATPSSKPFTDMHYKAVFELDVIAAPDNKLFKNGNAVSATAGVPPATYLVVPGSCNVELTYLHIIQDEGAVDRRDAPKHTDNVVTATKASSTSAAWWLVPTVIALIVALLCVAFAPKLDGK